MVTGREATKLQDQDEETLARLAEILKAGHGADLTKRAAQVMEELKENDRVIRQYKDRESAGGAADLVKNVEDVSGIHVVTTLLTEGDVNALRKLGDALRDKDERIAAVIALVTDGKVTLQAVCGKQAVADGVRAGDIIKAVAPIVGGRGGGKPDSAMGGGSDPAKAAEALASVKPFIAGKMN